MIKFRKRKRNPLEEFELFVGIDWSGAKGFSHRGIAVSEAKFGNSAPTIVSPPNNEKYWSRTEVRNYLIKKSRSKKILAGIDFAFAYPFVDEMSFFPGALDSPKTAFALWALIDEINADEPDFYGGNIWKDPVFSKYYNSPGNKGVLFRSRRRLTEICAKKIKSPSPTFNCIGPAGVGTGSLAGMRVLHEVRDVACRWPLEKKKKTKLTLVEIFPAFYFALSGIRPVKGNHARIEMLNKALTFFDSCQLPDDFVVNGPDFDEADAIISSAAIRALSKKKTTWMVPNAANQEGWIFGVEIDNQSIKI